MKTYEEATISRGYFDYKYQEFVRITQVCLIWAKRQFVDLSSPPNDFRASSLCAVKVNLLPAVVKAVQLPQKSICFCINIGPIVP